VLRFFLRMSITFVTTVSYHLVLASGAFPAFQKERCYCFVLSYFKLLYGKTRGDGIDNNYIYGEALYTWEIEQRGLLFRTASKQDKLNVHEIEGVKTNTYLDLSVIPLFMPLLPKHRFTVCISILVTSVY
jgi:hypothetical protein